MSDAFDGWDVWINDHGHFHHDALAINVYRRHSDGSLTVVEPNETPSMGVRLRHIESSTMVPDPEPTPLLIPRGAALALRDELNKLLGEAPDTKAEKVLHEALTIERMRVDAVLVAITTPAPIRPRAGAGGGGGGFLGGQGGG